MARQARIDAPGALHHIIIRGVERKAVFRDDRDREISVSAVLRLRRRSRAAPQQGAKR